MKKPYLDLWSYVNSLAPEVYVGEEINHQTWVDLSNLRSETYAGVPGQFIKYFAGKDEVEAKLGNGTRWFTRIIPGGHERLNSIFRSGKYSKLQKLQSEEWSFLSNLGNQGAGETVSIVQEYTFRGTFLPNEEELLREVAEEMQRVSTRVVFKAQYDCCQRWGDERTDGYVYPAPFGIPLVFDSRSRDLILSEYKHRQAEKRMLARRTSKNSAKRSNETLNKLNELASNISRVLKASPTADYTDSREFFKPLIPKAFVKEASKFGKYFKDNMVIDLSQNYSDGLVEYLLERMTNKQVAKLFGSRKWQSWWKRLVKAITVYQQTEGKIGSKLLVRNRRKHDQFLISAMVDGCTSTFRPLFYAAELPGWQIVKSMFVKTGLDKA